MTSREMRGKKRITTVTEVLILVAMAFITITLIYWGIVTSLKNTSEIAAYPPKVVGFAVIWSHYARILSSGYFKCVFNSALYSTAAITTGLRFGYLAAYGFERRNFPMKKILFYLVVVGTPLSTGSSVLLIPNYPSMMKFGLANHWYTMPSIYTTYSLPLCIWMTISGIRGFPYEIEEAAKIDGCDRFYLAIRLIPPMLKSSFAAPSLFIFIGAWNEYITTSVMVNGNNLKKILMTTYDYIGFFGQEWGPLCTTATVAVILILLVFTFLRKQLANGLTAGTVKSWRFTVSDWNQHRRSVM